VDWNRNGVLESSVKAMIVLESQRLMLDDAE
jgi:hypothetical protein